ncbi:Hypothetical_protein [Hexamita inflata]|uniref:Hypothetical_protein n=1 Tax=Hexamita inflata TaxID=28002 RepID=A0AA86V6F9_9EUKA|nr:Hypothetical protein HINF_LOCUS65762 [Hexamita inflata]
MKTVLNTFQNIERENGFKSPHTMFRTHRISWYLDNLVESLSDGFTPLYYLDIETPRRPSAYLATHNTIHRRWPSFFYLSEYTSPDQRPTFSIQQFSQLHYFTFSIHAPSRRIWHSQASETCRCSVGHLAAKFN